MRLLASLTWLAFASAVSSPVVAWQKALGAVWDPIAFSRDSQLAFVNHEDGFLVAVDTVDGHEHWRTQNIVNQTTRHNPPAVHPFRNQVYYSCWAKQDESAVLRSFDTRNGNELWRGRFSTGVFDGGIPVLRPDGEILLTPTLRGITGWSPSRGATERNYLPHWAWIPSRPTFSSTGLELYLQNPEGDHVIGVLMDMAEGRVAWNTTLPILDADSKPLNSEEAELNWKRIREEKKIGGVPTGIRTVVLSPEGERGYVVRHSSPFIYSVHTGGGNIVWSKKVGEHSLSTPALSHNGRVLFVAGDALYALDARTGNVLWSTPGLTIDNTPAISRDGHTVYASGHKEDGTESGLRAFSALTGQQKWFFAATSHNHWDREVYPLEKIVISSYEDQVFGFEIDE